MPAKVCFLGFGEVGSVLSQRVTESGGEVAAYDVLLRRERGIRILEARALVEGIRFDPLPKAVQDAQFVLSTVTTQSAENVARECSRYLRPGQIYLDLNSTSPLRKTELKQIIESSGADFIEGAILGAVGAAGADTHVLLGGSRGEEVAEGLTALGLNVSYYSSEIGKASMFKMLRSIFSKGLEALILELLLAGRRAGIQQDLWSDVVGFMTANPFELVAENWVRSHATAYERRFHEMVEVAQTMNEIGVDPIMTAGTEAFFRRSLSLGFERVFADGPRSMEEVIDFMAQQLAEGRA